MSCVLAGVISFISTFFLYQECISCCNVAYCNEAIPFNHSSAIQLSTILTSKAVAAYHVSPCNQILITLTAFLLVISQCYHGDELITLVAELKSVLLGCVSIVTFVSCGTTDTFVLLWRLLMKLCAKTIKAVPSYGDFVPSNHFRNTSASHETVQGSEYLIQNKSRMNMLLRSYDWRNTLLNHHDATVS